MTRDEYLKQCYAKSMDNNGATCKQCGLVFVKRNGGNNTNGSGSFCSRGCYHQSRPSTKSGHDGLSCKVSFNICDVCGKNKVEYYGRWFGYCEKCHKNGKGKKADNQKTFDNEIAPDIENGYFSYTMSHGLTDVFEEMAV